MNREEYLTKYPLHSPVQEINGKLTPIVGVTKLDKTKTILVSEGAAHKAIQFFEIINSDDIERVNDKDWELFTASYEGEIDGVKYYWGMFVEGIGAFNVQVVQEHCRDLTPEERAKWSKKTLGMYGSHSGKLSYTIPSPVTTE